MLAAVLAGIAFAGCEDDNIKVDTAIDNAFRQQYPDATRVEWEKKQGYYVADFRLNNTDAEAWYDRQGAWRMTERDVRYEQLPATVKTAFEAGEYSAWRIDDIDMLERPDAETVYIIEVEQGKVEYDLYYSTDGVLIKAVPDGGNSGGHQPSAVLPAVKEYIAAHYPQARIVDIDEEYNTIEVDIIDNKTPREVVFTKAGEWKYTKTEVRKADVPEVVLNALTASEYGAWRIDDIDMYQTADGDYYLFELESGSREIDLKINTNGNI